MKPAPCPPVEELLAWWLGELSPDREPPLEEHLLACGQCSRRLEAMLALGSGIREQFLRGQLAFVTAAPFIRRAAEAGLRVREYAMEPGGSVSCTIGPADDLVVAHLRAPLSGVRRLDVLIEDTVAGSHRATDVAFDPSSGTVTVVPSAAFLRTLGHARQHLRFVAVDEARERVIADYTFNHHPS